MSTKDAKFWQKVRQAHNQLVNKFFAHPAVSLIDIGYNQNLTDQESTQQIVLRVHVKPGSEREDLNLPTEIEGIPVCMIPVDYNLE